MSRRRDYPHVAVQALARLRQAPAFSSLPADTRRQLAHEMVRVTAYLKRKRGALSEPAESLVVDVDFPAFVDDLLKGTFEAIVDSSIQQMEAYAELLRDVATTVDQFVEVDDPTCFERHRQTVAVAVLIGVKGISGRPRD